MPTRALPTPTARLLASAAALTLFACRTPAQPRVLLDRELNESFAEVVSMSADTVTIRRSGAIENTPREQWLALLTPGEPWEAISDKRIALSGSAAAFGLSQRLVLTDGQRLFGRLVEQRSPGPETILWSIPGFEDIEVSLERLASLRLVSSSRERPQIDPTAGDAVVALNADVITGFVEAMGESLEIDSGSGVIDLPWALVREVHLANPPVAADDPLAWLADGSVVAFSAETIDPAGVFTATLALADRSSPGEPARGPLISLPAAQIRAIAFEPQRLMALSSIEPIVEPAGRRRWAPPLDIGDADSAQLGAAPITISGPAICEWALPEGALRVAGVAMLPEDSRLWGDYELVFGVRTSGGDTRELMRERINARQAMTPFNLPLSTESAPAGALLVRIESGAYGPIQDDVVLERTLILLAP